MRIGVTINNNSYIKLWQWMISVLIVYLISKSLIGDVTHCTVNTVACTCTCTFQAN